mmetsp:Transcript_1185/g.1339  ORF Transcript_1185/g.1339 Transcript_1185/m.1339 type:complete len:131 (-) Transcript_1185:2-394(-)
MSACSVWLFSPIADVLVFCCFVVFSLSSAAGGLTCRYRQNLPHQTQFFCRVRNELYFCFVRLSKTNCFFVRLFPMSHASCPPVLMRTCFEICFLLYGQYKRVSVDRLTQTNNIKAFKKKKKKKKNFSSSA